MTNQEIFEKVYHHLVSQKVPSRDDKGSCSYRGLNGTSCAVGCLIKDEHYDLRFEGRSVVLHDITNAVALSIGSQLLDDTIALLVSLQSLHDMNLTDTPFETIFDKFVSQKGKKFNINLDFVNQSTT